MQNFLSKLAEFLSKPENANNGTKENGITAYLKKPKNTFNDFTHTEFHLFTHDKLLAELKTIGDQEVSEDMQVFEMNVGYRLYLNLVDAEKDLDCVFSFTSYDMQGVALFAPAHDDCAKLFLIATHGTVDEIMAEVSGKAVGILIREGEDCIEIVWSPNQQPKKMLLKIYFNQSSL